MKKYMLVTCQSRNLRSVSSLYSALGHIGHISHIEKWIDHKLNRCFMCGFFAFSFVREFFDMTDMTNMTDALIQWFTKGIFMTDPPDRSDLDLTGVKNGHP